MTDRKETEPTKTTVQKKDDEVSMKVVNNITNNYIYVNKDKNDKLISGQKDIKMK